MESHTTTKSMVEAAVSAAMNRVLPADLAGRDPVVRRSEHADFQSNAAMALAGQAGRDRRELAAALAAAIDDRVVTASVAGPGFLNLTVPDEVLWRGLGDKPVGTGLAGHRIVVDYSGPNVAKPLHVGHLRSTVIGDALARILGALGADVIRQNHLGDWGTQFGMLIQYLEEYPGHVELGTTYRSARARFLADPAFADRCRQRVVSLQSGDRASLATWRTLVAESEEAFQAIYDRIGILLTPADTAGESMYNPYLDEVVDELVAAGIAVGSQGALCVFFDDITGPDGEPVPLIVRKNDGGYGYAATDLATVRYRVRELKADRILYLVDARQALHFRMVFATARRAGWLTDEVDAVHVPFGTVLGADGRPFKSRAGDTVPLTELIDAAVAAAAAVPGVVDPEATGVAALKYAELSNSRVKDYAFDVERMVALTGDTGVYLQYAQARARSILDRLGTVGPVDLTLPVHPAERSLLLGLDGYPAAVAEAGATLEPHRLCTYLYALAKAYAAFFEACPVLRADSPARQANRAALCERTADTLAAGLGLLGIAAPPRM